MNELKKDLKKLIKIAFKSTYERLKLLVLLIMTIGSLGGGLYVVTTMLEKCGWNIPYFLLGCVGIWFGIGMIDLFRDNFNKR